MIALIDNADSFTANIAQYLYEVTGDQPLIFPNTTRYADLPLAQIDAFVLSPGPGKPSRAEDFGVCAEVIAQADRPILGVCLGHQGINEAFGGRTVHAPQPRHGIADVIEHSGDGLFAGLPASLPVVRYHSLISTEVPESLEVTARTGDGSVMALAHRTLPIWGVQFHPESIASQGGRELLANFVRLAGVAIEPVASPTPEQPKLKTPTPVTPTPEPSSGVIEALGAVGGQTSWVLHVEQLIDPPDAASLFQQRYAAADKAFWLPSVMGAVGTTGVSLDYDLPTQTLNLQGPSGQRSIHGDVFDLLDDLVNAVHVDVPPGWKERFAGGLVGYFGYELKALAEGEAAHKAATPDAEWLFATDFVVLDPDAGQVFSCQLVPPGQAPEAPRTQPGQPPEAATPSQRPAYSPGLVDETTLGLRDDRAHYLAKIDQARRLITDGESYEICLTNLASREFIGSGLEVFEQMRAVSPVPYATYLKLGGIEVLSASPETYLCVRADGTITSRPIKGTRKRGTTTAQDAQQREDLATSIKDRAENLMITDLVRHDLNGVCAPGTVTVPSMFAIESYRSVHQMVSTVQGQLAASPLSAVRRCFPPGSMTGAPKVRTMQILDELEGAPRGIYSGALGWIGFNETLDLSVVIRTIVLVDGVATWGVGGAITALSDTADEFDETLIKASLAAWALSNPV
ncbi:chorismate-binding protein [Ornithinimicrobium sp. Arc0846-15]|nr:chorismate-binding protein [Ornithinimicrobium laminariae]